MAPLLKWAGGKRRIVADLVPMIPPDCARVVEPFVGGGALTLAAGRAHGVIADTSPFARLWWQAWMMQPALDHLHALLALYGGARVATAEHYARAVETAQAWFSQEKPNVRPETVIATLWYINKRGFNGLVRFNRSGGFNVPFDGSRAGRPVTVPSMDDLAAHAARVRGLTWRPDAAAALAVVEAGDFVYADPPFVGGFVGYGPATWTAADLDTLREALEGAATRGAVVRLSEHAETADALPGWRVAHTWTRSGRISAGARTSRTEAVFAPPEGR